MRDRCYRLGWPHGEEQDADNPCVCGEPAFHKGLHVCDDCGEKWAGGRAPEPGDPSHTCPKRGVTVTDQTPSAFYPSHDERCGGDLSELEDPSPTVADSPSDQAGDTGIQDQPNRTQKEER